jgi:hypothetical protein
VGHERAEESEPFAYPCGHCGFPLCHCEEPDRDEDAPYCRRCGGCDDSCENFDLHHFTILVAQEGRRYLRRRIVLIAPPDTIQVRESGEGVYVITPFRQAKGADDA